MKPICLLLFLLCSLLGLSQKSFSQNFPTKYYTIRDGLAQMQVMALLQDSRGILWVGTKGGLSRYDGIKFKNYRRADGDSLVHDMVWRIKEDSKGNIWICTAGGVSKFDGAKFQSWRFPNANDHGAEIYVSIKDEIFVTSELSYFQIINGKLVEIILKNKPGNLIKDRIFFDIEKDKIVMIFRDNEPQSTYYYYDLNGSVLTFFEKNSYKPEHCFLYGNKGIIYTYRYENTQKIQYWFLPKGQKTRKLILTVDANAVKVHQTLAFNFAFAFQNKLSILEKNTANYQQLADNFLDNSYIQVDKTGIWAGTETGLWRVIDNGLKYLSASRDAVVWSMVEDKYNRLWTLHYNTNVPIKIHDGTKTDDLTGYQESLSKQLGKPFANLYYYQPLKDQYQNLWLPSTDGLIRYDYNKFQLVFDSTYSFFLTEDKKRNLIISSVDKGVNIIENKPPYKVTALREKDGLHPNSQMLCVFVDSKGTHWYGSKGLTRYDYDKKIAFRYQTQSDKVPFRSVFFIVEDATNTLWFGTTSGLFRYLPRSDSFIRVAEQTIKGYIKIVGILDKNHLICTNDENVFVLNLTDYYHDNRLNIKTFNYNNGFMGLEPGQAGIHKTHDGKTWIASSDVLSIFDPKELDLSVLANKPIITKIDDQTVCFTKNTVDSIYQLPKGKVDGIRIEFSSTGFDNALHPKFSYRLDHEKWSDWQEEPFVILYQLGKGKHTFEVRTNVLGEQKGIVPLQANLIFRINIHFWQSPNVKWYLLVIIGLMFILLCLAFFKWLWERRLRRKMDDQQKELDFMKVVALQAQMNPHFIFNILGVLKSEISEGNISIAKDMVVKLSTLVRKYLEATSLDIGNKRKSIFSTEITIEEELELLRLFVEFEHIKANSNFSYDFKIDDNVFTNNLTIPPMIIQPIVENAIKHGLLDLPRGITGSLEINVSYCLKILCFEIKDTGVGFKKSAEIKSKTVRHHKSKGESLVKERIRLLNEAGYKITLYPPKDLEPHGTQIIVCFDNNW